MIERILKMLDTPEGRALVIRSQYDWAGAFDRQDPTKTVNKFILMDISLSQCRERNVGAANTPFV